MDSLPPNSVIAAETIPGSPLLKEPKAPPCAVVIFGVTGDLSKRKLGARPLQFGCRWFAARTSCGHRRQPHREAPKSCVSDFAIRRRSWGGVNRSMLRRGANSPRPFDFVNGQVDDPKTYADLKEKLATDRSRERDAGQPHLLPGHAARALPSHSA